MIDKYVKKEKKRIDREYQNIEELNKYQEQEKRILDIEEELLSELAHLVKKKNYHKEICVT